MRKLKRIFKAGVAMTALLTGAPAMAQQLPYGAGYGWGATPTYGPLDSSIAHNQNGQRAGLDEAARKGLLLQGGTSYSVTANGVVNQTTTTVTGSGNTISGRQDGTNTGATTAQGQFNTGRSGDISGNRAY